jgi:hypothetical protein
MSSRTGSRLRRIAPRHPHPGGRDERDVASPLPLEPTPDYDHPDPVFS